jgi:formylglycine-generating enzyme required for sulfatase activity
MNTVKVRHANGGTDYLVRIAKFKLSDVIDGASDTVHPAFIVNGKEVEEIYISKYQNAMIDGVPYSLPYQRPQEEISIGNAAAACRLKGDGWHLMTNAEWAAIALWSLKNGTLPHGNTDKGKYHADKTEKGLLYDDYSVLTGSGPATWSHDGTEDGIYDLAGNLWEWVSGVRLRKGRLQIIVDNNAATASATTESEAWIDTGYGYDISDSGNGIDLTEADDASGNYGGEWFNKIKTYGEAPELLKALALIPPVADTPDVGYFWADNEEDERCRFVGADGTTPRAAACSPCV